jgi:hypothetical protein
MAGANPKRLNELSGILHPARMKRVWKETVRDGLRDQLVLDLHDYLDIHRNLDAIVDRVRADILSGNYRPTEPDVFTVEKKLGIPRRLVLPSATDAVVLQAIVDVLEERVRKAQPCKNAFYSRSHGRMPSVEKFTRAFGYPWWHLWPEFQKKIWKFSREARYTVTTDISNYFDCIALDRLRRKIAALSCFDESVMDFLFLLLEAFVWRPDYIPLSGVGLPQINFDAPRLLAHSFLFSVDEMLHSRTGDRYVRWMDDMDFGVDSEHEARQLLRDLDQLLASLGVRVNTSKTDILDQESAAQHFWIDENIAINILNNTAKHGTGSDASHERILAQAQERWVEFLAAPRVGQWEKVFKRYLTLFGTLDSERVQSEIPRILKDRPGLRDSALHYLDRLGFSPDRMRMVVEYMLSGYCCDDASWFSCARVLVDWLVPTAQPLESLISRVEHFTAAELAPARFAGCLWLLAKYADADSLGGFILRMRSIWSHSPWAARQAFAGFGMLNEHHRARLKDLAAERAPLESLGVLQHVQRLEDTDVLDTQLKWYLVKARPEYFTLPKFVLAMSLLRWNRNAGLVAELRSQLHDVVLDPIYSQRLAETRSRAAHKAVADD